MTERPWGHGAVGPDWFTCCTHCGCPASKRLGHDDTCASGCNDGEGEA